MQRRQLNSSCNRKVATSDHDRHKNAACGSSGAGKSDVGPAGTSRTQALSVRLLRGGDSFDVPRTRAHEQRELAEPTRPDLSTSKQSHAGESEAVQVTTMCGGRLEMTSWAESPLLSAGEL